MAFPTCCYLRMSLSVLSFSSVTRGIIAGPPHKSTCLPSSAWMRTPTDSQDNESHLCHPSTSQQLWFAVWTRACLTSATGCPSLWNNESGLSLMASLRGTNSDIQGPVLGPLTWWVWWAFSWVQQMCRLPASTRVPSCSISPPFSSCILGSHSEWKREMFTCNPRHDPSFMVHCSLLNSII